VLAAALSFGLGDLLVPGIFEHLFDGVKNPNKALQGFFDSITIVLSTPFLSAGIVAAVLNLILPHDVLEDVEGEGTEEVNVDIESQTKEK